MKGVILQKMLTEKCSALNVLNTMLACTQNLSMENDGYLNLNKYNMPALSYYKFRWASPAPPLRFVE